MIHRVTGCSNCPFLAVELDQTSCNHPEEPSSADKAGDYEDHYVGSGSKSGCPTWCPLRAENIIIGLNLKDIAPKHDTHRSGDGNYPGLPFHP